jgi:hypothetical protein
MDAQREEVVREVSRWLPGMTSGATGVAGNRGIEDSAPATLEAGIFGSPGWDIALRDSENGTPRRAFPTVLALMSMVFVYPQPVIGRVRTEHKQQVPGRRV